MIGDDPMAYVISAAPQTSVAVAGTADRFPVHRIYCVGRNYAAHSREMGHDPDREPPFFFQKPADTIVPEGGEFPYPSASSSVHYEMELVVALAKGGDNIAAERALDYVYGYGVGLDMTRRDLQNASKDMGRPWESGKAFECSAPCSRIYPVSQVGHPSTGSIWLTVNGDTKQQADLADMIWDVPHIIAYLSELFTLQPGDLIYTGTPAGVGSIQRGDVMRGGVDKVGEIEIKVV
jgi:fumarylpyruvate hydrolase